MTSTDPNRTSRLPTLRRFRDARAKMAFDASVARAEAFTAISAQVTDLILAAQQEMTDRRAERLEARAELREKLAAFRTDLSEDVAQTLERFAEEHAALRPAQRDAADALRARLQAEVERILTTDFA